MLSTGSRAEHSPARTLTHASFDFASAMRHDVPITTYSNTYKHTYSYISIHMDGDMRLHVSDNINNFILAKGCRIRKLMVTVAATREQKEEKEWAGRGVHRVPSNC